ncbi:MAG: 4'-phosphopantetheinyl transferase superfamily protein [Rickettsiaceae bacterium]|nr:4'-phosphopantetheinyl transferase superfamily protein [Rickettsiaceae bacterium]
MSTYDCEIKFFYKLWIKKESLVKTIGCGLSYPINIIDTTLLISMKQ